MNTINRIGQALIDRKYEIVRNLHQELVGLVEDSEKLRIMEEMQDEILEMRAELVNIFGQIIRDQSSQQEREHLIEQWGAQTGETIYHLGAHLDEALFETRFYRKHIWNVLKDEIQQNGVSIEEIVEISEIFHPLLDHAVYSFSLTFVKFHQQALSNAKLAFLELSVPVVPVAEGVAILPIIGTIDTERARLLMEETLQSATKLHLNKLIIDLSGVVVVDTMVADQLFKVASALKLLGVEIILTGIRPEVAQTVVSLGIQFESIVIKANLKEAMSIFVKDGRVG
ncbi:STAS domain-containing protein [Bacillus coahuilensis]|uniref:STAS domain-containing protein n=1 Tax=Bacillus coahuilensis TaxID=408580 RepID=UPI00058BDC57|nr:STAS domain-containing protein [Bacillus coahuilensis]